MKKSKQSAHFERKENLRMCGGGYMHKTSKYNQTGSPTAMADGGEVPTNYAARQAVSQGAGKNFDPRNRIEAQEAEAMGAPEAAPSAMATAAASRPSPQAPAPSAWKSLKNLLGFADGGAVMPQSLRCYEDGGFVANDDEEGMDRAVLKPGEGYKGFASGGAVRGPGGPRDDKIPALLSNGEYVLPADTVAHVGKENLDALKNATHKPTLRMAGGGPVESPMALFKASQLDHGTGANTGVEGPEGPGSELTMGGAAKSISMRDGGSTDDELYGRGSVGQPLSEGPGVRRSIGVIGGTPFTNAPSPKPLQMPEFKTMAPSPLEDPWRGAKAVAAPGGALGWASQQDAKLAPAAPMARMETPTLKAMSPAPVVPTQPAPGIMRLGNSYSGSGEGEGGRDTTDYKAVLAGMNANEAAGQDQRQAAYANLAANYVSPEDRLRAKHMNTPIPGATNSGGQSSLRSGGWNYGGSPADKELAVQARGQDVGLEAARSGHAVQLRGQDMAANTASNEQQVQLRGQSLSNNLGMINAMRAYQMEQARFGLETQRFGLDKARTYQETRQQNTKNYEGVLKDALGINAKDGGNKVDFEKMNKVHNLIQGELNNRGITIGDLKPEDQAALVKEATRTQNLSDAQKGVVTMISRFVTGMGQYKEPGTISEGQAGEGTPGAVLDTLRTAGGDVSARQYKYPDNPGSFLHIGENEDLGRARSAGNLFEKARLRKKPE